MTENEQIQEIAKIAAKSDDTCRAATIAKGIYNADYRKASEVAKEIIADMRKMINGYENIDVYLDRIEKKYTEGKK